MWNQIAPRLGQVVLPLELLFAVDDLGLRRRLSILQRRFLARLRFQLRLLNLLLFQRQQCTASRLLRPWPGKTCTCACASACFTSRLLRLRFQLRDLGLFQLDLLVGAELFVLLLFQQ